MSQVMEKLYRSKWSALDGLGALIISPTRELALQIFDELRKVGKKHELSAGLLIGGKKVKEEQERVHGEWPARSSHFVGTDKLPVHGSVFHLGGAAFILLYILVHDIKTACGHRH